MKISGPDSTQPLGPTGAVSGTDAPDPVGPTQATSQASATDPIRVLAQELAAGRITAHQAMERLVERAVNQVAAATTPETIEKLRAALLQVASRDPHVLAKVERLQGWKR